MLTGYTDLGAPPLEPLVPTVLPAPTVCAALTLTIPFISGTALIPGAVCELVKV